MYNASAQQVRQPTAAKRTSIKLNLLAIVTQFDAALRMRNYNTLANAVLVQFLIVT